MTKRQSISIAILLFWFAHTFTFYTSTYWMALSAEIGRAIKNAGFLPGWLNGFIFVVLANIDQYLSITITGVLIGLIFPNHKQSFLIMAIIYVAFIIPGVFLAIAGLSQMQISKSVFITGKITVYFIEYLLIYFSMAISHKIFRGK